METLGMLNPKFQLMHITLIASWLKRIAAASFDKLKQEIKAPLSNGSKVALALDAWTARNHTKYIGVIGYWVNQWQLTDGILGLIPYEGGRQLTERKCNDIISVRELVDIHMTIVNKLLSTMHRGSFEAISNLSSSTGFKWPSSQT